MYPEHIFLNMIFYQIKTINIQFLIRNLVKHFLYLMFTSIAFNPNALFVYHDQLNMKNCTKKIQRLIAFVLDRYLLLLFFLENQTVTSIMLSGIATHVCRLFMALVRRILVRFNYMKFNQEIMIISSSNRVMLKKREKAIYCRDFFDHILLHWVNMHLSYVLPRRILEKQIKNLIHILLEYILIKR